MPGRDYYLKGRNDSTLMAYQSFAADVAKMLNADPDRADREMEEMVDLEVKLANVGGCEVEVAMIHAHYCFTVNNAARNKARHRSHLQ